MKSTILFKTLIDIFYFIHLSGLFLLLISVPFGVIDISKIDLNSLNGAHFNLSHWMILFIAVIAYVVFLRGLFYLRKVARFILANNYFTETVILNLKKTGQHFLYTGIICFLVILFMLLDKLYGGKIEIEYDGKAMTVLFITIVGLFFIMISKTLSLAKGFKEENELTV